MIDLPPYSPGKPSICACGVRYILPQPRAYAEARGWLHGQLVTATYLPLKVPNVSHRIKWGLCAMTTGELTYEMFFVSDLRLKSMRSLYNDLSDIAGRRPEGHLGFLHHCHDVGGERAGSCGPAVLQFCTASSMGNLTAPEVTPTEWRPRLTRAVSPIRTPNADRIQSPVCNPSVVAALMLG